jgi:hypothetical protein
MASEAWMPDYVKEDRDIAKDRTSYGEARHMWGNVPGHDILKLENHEGVDYRNKIGLCFAGKLLAILTELLLISTSKHRVTYATQ